MAGAPRFAESPWLGTDLGRGRLADLALDLITDRVGDVFLFRASITTRTTVTGVRRLLDSALERETYAILQRSDRIHLASVFLSDPGHVILQLRSSDVLVPSDVEQLRGIGRAWAPDCDFVALTATYTSAIRIEQVVRDSPAPADVPGYYRLYRDLDQELVPDAFPWQILTGRHLQRAADLSAWSVTEVAPDRYEVCAPELAVPHLDASAARRLTAPTEAETHRARLDFGPMINTQRP